MMKSGPAAIAAPPRTSIANTATIANFIVTPIIVTSLGFLCRSGRDGNRDDRERLSDNQSIRWWPGLHHGGPEMYTKTIKVTITTGAVKHGRKICRC
jgi:hypothetical protein